MIVRELVARLAIDANLRPLTQANRALDNTGRTMRDVESRSSRLRRNISMDFDQMKRSFERAQPPLVKFADSFKAELAGIALGAAAALTVPIKIAGDFQASISRLEAIGGVAGDTLKQLRDEALRLGRTTVFTATQVADAQTELAKAGFNANEVLAAMPGVLDAAVASGEDLTQVSEIVTATIRGMGLEAKESSRIADVLALAANKTKADISGLGESLKFAAPPAKLLGLSLEDVTTAAALMSDAGLDAGIAGRSLRAGLLRLATPSAEARKAMSQLNVQFFDSAGKIKPLPMLIAELERATKGMTDQQKVATLEAIFGQEAVSGWGAVLDRGSEAVAEFSKQLGSSAGVARDTAQTMQDNVPGAFTKLTSAMEGFAITIGDPFLKPLQAVLEAFTSIVNEVTAFIKTIGPVGTFLIRAAGALIIMAGGLSVFGLALLAKTKLVNMFRVGLRALARIDIPQFIAGIRAGRFSLLTFSGAANIAKFAIRGLLGPIGLVITAFELMGLAADAALNPDDSNKLTDFQKTLVDEAEKYNAELEKTGKLRQNQLALEQKFAQLPAGLISAAGGSGVGADLSEFLKLNADSSAIKALANQIQKGEITEKQARSRLEALFALQRGLSGQLVKSLRERAPQIRTGAGFGNIFGDGGRSFFTSLPEQAQEAIEKISGGDSAVQRKLLVTLSQNRSLLQPIIDSIEREKPTLEKTVVDLATFIDDHLPKSPAKRGPLKNLGKVGAGLTKTIADGIIRNQDVVGGALNSALIPSIPSPSYRTGGGLAPSMTIAPVINVNVHGAMAQGEASAVGQTIGSEVVKVIEANRHKVADIMAPFVRGEIFMTFQRERNHLPLDRQGFGQPSPVTG